jgi:hypothetical protein
VLLGTFQAFVGPGRQLDDLIREGSHLLREDCARLTVHEQGKIAFVIGVVSNSLGSLKRAKCIQAQIMHGAGFSQYSTSQIFREPSSNINSEHIELVRMLYSAAIGPGQIYSDVRKVVLGH